MRTLTLHIQDNMVNQVMQFLNSLPKQSITIVENPPKKRDLSKLVAHPNAVNGNPDDLVDISWEKKLNLDLPN